MATLAVHAVAANWFADFSGEHGPHMSPEAILTVDAEASCCVLRSLALIKYTFRRWADLRTQWVEMEATVNQRAAPKCLFEGITMKMNVTKTSMFGILVLAELLGALAHRAAQDHQAPDPNKASLV